MFDTNDNHYMEMAINLAKKGVGNVNPNPLVGAIIVKNNTVIGEGYHEKFGGLHAERNAFLNCNDSTTGATIYVTLEPCCHYGKTPPCTDIIIESGIKRVVVGSLDPNHLVAGKGVEILKKAGISVDVGIMENECVNLNYIFFHFIKHKTPFVLMKYAMTFDGKIATVNGKSKWITNEKSRNFTHETRNRYSAIMVGVGTVLADNPLLTTRLNTAENNEMHENTKNPIRIICDTNLRTPINSQVVQTAKSVPTIIATSVSDVVKHKVFTDFGCSIIAVKKDGDHIDLHELMKELGRLNIDSVILEGGSQLNFSALKSSIVNRLHTYIAPKIFGGLTAKTPVGGEGFFEVDNGIILKPINTYNFDNDILIESEVTYNCLQEL